MYNCETGIVAASTTSRANAIIPPHSSGTTPQGSGTVLPRPFPSAAASASPRGSGVVDSDGVGTWRGVPSHQSAERRRGARFSADSGTASLSSADRLVTTGNSSDSLGIGSLLEGGGVLGGTGGLYGSVVGGTGSVRRRQRTLMHPDDNYIDMLFCGCKVGRGGGGGGDVAGDISCTR